MKKFLAMLLVLAMVLSMVPMTIAGSALAADVSYLQIEAVGSAERTETQLKLVASIAANDVVTFDFRPVGGTTYDEGIFDVRTHDSKTKLFYAKPSSSTPGKWSKGEQTANAGTVDMGTVTITALEDGWYRVSFKVTVAQAEGLHIGLGYATVEIDNLSIGDRVCSFDEANVVEFAAENAVSLKFDDGTEFSIKRSVNGFNWKASLGPKKASITTASVTLGQSLALNVYADGVVDGQSAFVKFTMNDKPVDVVGHATKYVREFEYLEAIYTAFTEEDATDYPKITVSDILINTGDTLEVVLKLPAAVSDEDIVANGYRMLVADKDPKISSGTSYGDDWYKVSLTVGQEEDSVDIVNQPLAIKVTYKDANDYVDYLKAGTTIGIYSVKVNDTTYYMADKVNTTTIKFEENETVTVESDASDAEFIKGQGVEGEYAFTFTGIEPQQMGDDIKMELYVDGQKVDEKTTSIKANLEALVAMYPNNADIAALVEATLDYGAAAQIYQNYNVNDLVADGVVDFTKPQSVKDSTTTPGAGVAFTSAKLWWDYANKIIFTFDPADLANDITAKINGVDVDVVVEGGVYTVSTDAISALQFGDTYEAQLLVGGQVVATATYSVNSYVASKCEGSNENLANLVKALYNYGVCAVAYAN